MALASPLRLGLCVWRAAVSPDCPSHRHPTLVPTCFAHTLLLTHTGVCRHPVKAHLLITHNHTHQVLPLVTKPDLEKLRHQGVLCFLRDYAFCHPFAQQTFMGCLLCPRHWTYLWGAEKNRAHLVPSEHMGLKTDI